MKKCIILLMGMILGLALFPQAQIKFKETTLNFGDIESGKIVNLTFEFENTGKNTLVIKDIRTSCGCTVAKFEKKEYKPGEKGTIPIQFFSRGRSGRISQAITVSSNDESNVYTELTITGNVLLKYFANIDFDQNRIDFGDVKVGETYEKIIKIKNSGNQELNIIEIIHSPEILLHMNQKQIAAEQEMEVRLVFTPMYPVSQTKFITYVKIRSNALNNYLAIVRVEADIKAESGR